MININQKISQIFSGNIKYEGERDNPVFNERGKFTPVEIMVGGDRVLDAASEVNDKIPENTAFTISWL